MLKNIHACITKATHVYCIQTVLQVSINACEYVCTTCMYVCIAHMYVHVELCKSMFVRASGYL